MRLELTKCLDDFDYEGAHLFQKALRSKSLEYNALVSIEKPNNDEIRRYQRKALRTEATVKSVKEELATSKRKERYMAYLRNRLKESENQLDEYNNIIISLHKTNKSEHIDNDFVLIEIEHFFVSDRGMFCIELYDHHPHYILVSNLEDSLSIEYVISDVNPRVRKIVNHSELNLSRLGFKSIQEDVWKLTLAKNEVDRDQVLYVLSSICFDVIRPSKDVVSKLTVDRSLLDR